MEGLERYLQDIKVDSLKKYVTRQDQQRLEHLFEKFSHALAAKEVRSIADVVDKILDIIPTDPFFRVYKRLILYEGMDGVFSGKLRLVQTFRWDWITDGNPSSSVYIGTADTNGKRIKYGPLKNNIISMIDKPLRGFINIEWSSTGGRFEVFPTSLRIGWSVAELRKDGSWEPLIAYAEYDPFIRLGRYGALES